MEKQIENFEKNLGFSTPDRIQGPFRESEYYEDRKTIMTDYYIVNGTRISETEYNEWREKKENEFCESL